MTNSLTSTFSAWMDLVPITLHQPVYFLIFNCVWVYVVGEVTQNMSQVDRVWTFLPTLYTSYFALAPYFSWAPIELQQNGPNSRAQLMLALQFVWMLRLCYNTNRRGLFSLKEEDYRWIPLRQSMNAWQWRLFALFFIAIMQNMILFAFGLPAYNALTHTANTPLATSDYTLATLALIIVALEFTADNQQYAYQTWKRTSATKVDPSYTWPGARLAFTESDRTRGFITRGLWAWSRHPNFACEQSFWTFIPILAAPPSYHHHLLTSSLKPPYSAFTFLFTPALAPALTVMALFYSSTLFSEYLSAAKYPAYKAYQRRVGMFMPPETLLRGLILTLLGKRKDVEVEVWGDSLKARKSL